jgi:S1-C subfamily serine protease
MTVSLINATVEIDQPTTPGRRQAGTGFLVSDPLPDGTPRVVLVTANHVFANMTGDDAGVGYREQQPDGAWKYAPEKIPIRQAGRPLWVRHPTRDVAVIVVSAPEAFARAALPLDWLAGDDLFAQFRLEPGAEMLALGFPEGLASNDAGFPILRWGRVASYPLSPPSRFPVFLLDFRVFPGNSGGPVCLDTPPGDVAGDPALETPVVAGVLTDRVVQEGESLEMGVVTPAKFIRETLSLLDAPPPPPGEPAASPSTGR